MSLAFYQNFLLPPPYDARIVTTRTTKAWGLDVQGNLVEYAINVPAKHVDDFGNDFGLRRETKSANQSSSPDMSGAAVGVVGSGGSFPNGWVPSSTSNYATWEVLALGKEDNFDMLEFEVRGLNNTGGNGSATVNFSTTTAVVAAQGEDWAYSIFGKLAGPPLSHPMQLGMVERDVGGASTGTFHFINPVPLTAKRQRFKGSATLTNGSTARITEYINWNVPNTETLSARVRVYVPQLEKRKRASSPIIGPGRPNSRDDDYIRITGANFDFHNPTEHTYIMRGGLITDANDYTFPRHFSVDDGTANERLSVSMNSSLADGKPYPSIAAAGANVFSVFPFVAGIEIPFTVAVAAKSGDHAYAIEGAIGDTSSSASMPAAPTGMGFGSGSQSATFQGGDVFFSELAVDNLRLPNAVLEEITRNFREYVNRSPRLLV